MDVDVSVVGKEMDPESARRSSRLNGRSDGRMGSFSLFLSQFQLCCPGYLAETPYLFIFRLQRPLPTQSNSLPSTLPAAPTTLLPASQRSHPSINQPQPSYFHTHRLPSPRPSSLLMSLPRPHGFSGRLRQGFRHFRVCQRRKEWETGSSC